MDVFIEKIVSRKKTTKDHMMVVGIILGGFILSIAAFTFIGPVAPAVVAAVVYFGYYFAKGTNLEYEYAVTNGDIDVDKIIAQRKRKRVFSAYTKDIEIVAKLKGSKFTGEYNNIRNRVEAVSSMDDAQDIYFMVAPFKGERTILFFQPDQRMLDSFKIKMPHKYFEY